MPQGKQFAVFEGLQCLCLHGQQVQEQLHCLPLKIKAPLSFELLKTLYPKTQQNAPQNMKPQGLYTQNIH
jgi:hypothetical protein